MNLSGFTAFLGEYSIYMNINLRVRIIVCVNLFHY